MDDNDRLSPDSSPNPFDWGEEFPGENEGLDPDVLRFELSSLACAVDADLVTEVALLPTVTPIPGLPRHVLGVAVRRRKVLGVLDLAAFLGIEGAVNETCRMLVLAVDGLEVGAIVTATSGLEMWPDDEDAPQPEDVSPKVRKYTLGTHWAPGGRVLLLDLPAIIRDAAVT